MIKLAIVFVVGLGLGYTYGYREASAGERSIMARVFDSFGASKIKEHQEQRDRATDAVSP